MSSTDPVPPEVIDNWQVLQVEDCVYEMPLQLSPALMSQQGILANHLLSARRRLIHFARQHGWGEYIHQPFAKRAQIYDDKAKFDRDLLEINGLDTTIELPRTYCAALEKNILFSVSPDLYRTLYPEGEEQNAFEKLLAHEMAHRLHIRILGGDEDAMGPVWFYEGFALYAANQFEGLTLQMSPGEIWDLAGSEERGDYRRYAFMFHYFVGRIPLQQLVEMARETDFISRLKAVTEQS